MNKGRLSVVNFIRKSRSKSFNNGIVYNRNGFICTCETISRQYTELFYNFLPKQLNLEDQWEVLILEVTYPSTYQNVTEGNFLFSDKKFSKSSEFCYLEPGFYSSVTAGWVSVNMQGEHWIMIANPRQILVFFADSLGLKRYSFLPQQHEQIKPEPI